MAILPTLESSVADGVTLPLNAACAEFEINTPLRLAAFIAQTGHESAAYSRMRENLNYSAARLMAVFPKHFPTLAKARVYERDPERIGNKVYSGRMGNGPEGSGDGWKYRGRGPLMLTGKDNYSACGRALGLDLVNSPELLEEPAHGFRAAGWFWRERGLNRYADSQEFEALTRKINGGTNGLNDRLKLYSKAKIVLRAI